MDKLATDTRYWLGLCHLITAGYTKGEAHYILTGTYIQ